MFKDVIDDNKEEYDESLNENVKTDKFFVGDNDSGYMYHGIDEVLDTVEFRINKNIFPIIIDKAENIVINEAPDLSKKKGTSTNVLTKNDSWKNCTSVNDLYNTIKKLFDENNLHSTSNNTLLNKIKSKKNLTDALMLVYNSILKGSNLGVTEDIDSQYRGIDITNTMDATQAAELQEVEDGRRTSMDNMKEKNKETAEFIDDEGKKYVTEKLHLNEDSDIDESCNKNRKKRRLKEMANEKRDMWTEIYEYLARVKYEGKHGKELTAFRQGFVGYDNIYVVNDIDIGISVPKEEDLDYAKRVAEKFNLEYEIKAPTLTHKNYEMIIYIPEEYVKIE